MACRLLITTVWLAATATQVFASLLWECRPVSLRRKAGRESTFTSGEPVSAGAMQYMRAFRAFMAIVRRNLEIVIEPRLRLHCMLGIYYIAGSAAVLGGVGEVKFWR